MRESDQASTPEVDDLVAGLRAVVAHSTKPGLAVQRARLMNRLAWCGAWIAKDAGQARVRALTIKRFRAERPQTRQLAATVRAGRSTPVRQALLPGLLWGVGHAFDTLVSRMGRRDDASMDINLDALTADDEETVKLPRPHRRNWLGQASALVLLVASVIACRSLLGFGALLSTGLAPAPDNLAEAWRAWLVPSTPVGANAPWLGIMAFGATLFGGQPGIWAGVLVFGGVFLASWSAYRFVRVFMDSSPVCVGLALLWGVMLPVTGASGDGSPGWVILAVGLPLLARAMVRWAKEPVKGLVGLRVPATAALALALVFCVTPALWVPAVIGAVAIAWRTRDWRGMVIIAIGPWLLLGPWIPRLMSQPGRLLTGVDPLLSRLIAAPDPLQILVGRIGLGSVTPIWFGAAVLGAVCLLGLFGVACLPASRNRVWLLVGMAASVVAAIVASRVTVVIDGQITRAAILPWLLVGTILAIGVAAAIWPIKAPVAHIDDEDVDDDAPPPRHFGRRVIVSTLVIIGAGFGAVWWLWAGQGQPLHRESMPVPDYVMAAEQSSRDTRTLVVVVAGGQASVSLRDANSPTWGSGERSPITLDASDRAAVVALAGQFADGFGTDDLASRLGALGIGHVVVQGVSQAATDSMSGVPDLAGGTVGKLTIWTVGGLPSRTQLLEDGNMTPITDGVIAPGASGRQVVLLEASDMPWWASVNGVRLPAGDSPTSFQVPAAGGTLTWGLPVMTWAFWSHLVALLLLVWMALPASSIAERLAKAEARRAVG